MSDFVSLGDQRLENTRHMVECDVALVSVGVDVAPLVVGVNVVRVVVGVCAL